MSLCLPDKTLLWRPSDALLPNPHKGFVSFQRFAGDQLNDNWSADRGWKMEHLPDGLFALAEEKDYYHPNPKIAYFRVPWRNLEPEEGVYDFSLLDRIFSEARARGQHVMLRFPPHDARPGALDLPEWLKKKANLPEREIGDKVTPDHPLYFEHYEKFVRAVGAYADGNPLLSAVDLSIVGAWGEGAKIALVPEERWRPIVDAHMEAFRVTPMIAQHNHPASVRRANSFRPVGFRADCLGNMKIHMIGEYARRFSALPRDLWEQAPIAFESCWVMGHWYNMGWDLDEIIEQSLKWHISTFNAKSSPVPEEWRDKVEGWIKKMGYRFALRRLDYPQSASCGENLRLGFWIENRGVAPLYHPFVFTIRLKGEGGVFEFASAQTVTQWLPGDVIADETIPTRGIPAGRYELQVGLCLGPDRVRFATDGETDDGFLKTGAFVALKEVSVRK